MIPIDSDILALAGAGLPGARPLAREDWGDRLDDVATHGLAGILGWAGSEGLVALDEKASHQLDLRLESEAIRAVQLEGELIRLERVLTDLRAVVLKGAILAHAAYPDPSLRPFTDLDILVSGRHHHAAVRALEALGYQRTRPEPAPGYDARVGKALTLTHPGGVVVDLHRTLVAGNLGDAIDVEEILAERQSIPLDGVAIPGPSWEAHLVEVALHAVLGDGLARALSIRDIAQVALHPDLDVDRAVELVDRWRAAEPVAHGLRAAIDGIGVELPGPLDTLAGLHPALTPTAPPASRSAKRRVDELLHGNIGRRLTLTRALVAPTPAFMRWSYGQRATPQLYGRRWIELYRRAMEARGRPPTSPATPGRHPDAADAPAPGPVTTPPASDLTEPGPAASARAITAAADAPDRAGVSLAPRPAVAPVTRRLGAADPNTRLHPRPRSRQERWSDKRIPRAASDARRPPPPAMPVDGAGTDALSPTGQEAPRSATLADGGLRIALAGVGVLLLTAIVARLGFDFLGIMLVPVAGIVFAVAAGRTIARRRPDEAWIGRFLVLGVVVKVAASYVRYLTLVGSYDGQGDALMYDEYGRKFADAWMGSGIVPELDNWRKTNFIRVFTGWVYFIFGSNVVAGFFIFGLFALVGSYFWYRATVDAVPGMNKKLYLGLVLFAPSIAFWPSSIGKESLMQLGIGVAALGTSYLLRQQLLLGLAIGLAGGWLLWVVRPHLLALVTIAAGCAYVAGRVRSSTTGVGSLTGRPIGVLVIALLMAFAVSQATKSLGISELSLSAIESELDQVSEQTGQGGSKFDSGGNSLNPLNLPNGAVTVLFRPLPYEVRTPFELLSSFESMILLALIIKRWPSVRTALRRARGSPFLLYCIVLLILYAATFSSFANFGILARQRSLVMPALFVLIAVNPVAPRPKDQHGLLRPDAAPISEPPGSRSST